MRASGGWLWVAPVIIMLAAGGGGGGNPTPTYTLGVTLSGLGSSKTLVLGNNGGDNLTLSANGSFTFATPANQGTAYNVTVLTQPAGQTCTVSNGSGTFGSAHVTNVGVTCVAAFTVSGTITAASGSVTDSDVNDPNAAYAANDDIATAQPIGNPATVGGYVNQPGSGEPGPSQAAGDANDVFRVTLAAGQVLTLTIGDTSTRDVDLFLLDGAGGIVVSSEGEGTTETITVATAGNYLINVFAFLGASNYTLTIGQSISTTSPPPLSVLSEFVPGELIARFEPPTATKRGAQALGTRDVHGGTSVAGGRMLEATIKAMGMALTTSAAAVAEQPVLIKLDESTLSATSAAAGATPAKEVLPLGIAGNTALERKWRTLRAIKQLGKQPGVRYAEPNYILKPSATPNDAAYRQQWHYPLINLPQAWDITTGSNTGSSAVIVAVIDTGVLLAHPDLQSQLVSGYDFISDPANARDSDGRDADPNDPGDSPAGRSSFHGTHVAGTIAAATNNATGVAGVAWNARIMPLRVLGLNGGSSDDINQAILYAAGLSNASGALPTQRADIINMSLGGPNFSRAQQDVITQARNQGVIIIAAAGNEAQQGNPIGYPAAYDGVVSVGAVDMNKARAPYSSFNAFVDIAAPGGNMSRDLNGDGNPDGVLSTAGDDSGGTLSFVYKPYQGTSMAAPHVAGVAALMKALNPALTPAQFDSLLENGQLTQDLGAAGLDAEFGYGLVDARAAVVAAQTTPAPAPAKLVATPNGLNFGTQGTNATLSLVNSGDGSLSVTSASVPIGSSSWLTVGAASDPTTGLGTRTVIVNREGLAEGTYTAEITLVSTVNTVKIPVIMQVSNSNVVANAGFHYVLLLDPTTGATVYDTQLSANNGVYQFSIPDVVAGSYIVVAGSDFNNDLLICDAGEACGGYPVLDSFAPLQVSGSVTGVDFGTGFNTVIRAQSVGAPGGRAGSRGYPRFSGKRVGR